MTASASRTLPAAAWWFALCLLPAGAFAAPGFDGDADGLEDTADACPLSPAGAVVDRQGCALDEDVDGTADGVDRCPNTPLGAAVDARGCASAQRPVSPALARGAAASAPSPSVVAVNPAPAALPGVQLPRILGSSEGARAVQPLAVSGAAGRQLPELTLYFDGGDARLSPESRRALEDTQELLREDLERHAQATLVLSGHADTKSDGTAAAPRLAAQRVSAVRQALIEAGLPPQRLSVRAVGVGEPRYAGAELARNCRVEIRMQGRGSAPPQGLTGRLGPAPPPVDKRPPPRLPTVVVAKYRPPASSAVAVAASVSFAHYSARLDDRATITLSTFAANLGDRLRKHPQTQVVISGSIDGSETGVLAQRLSQSRAVSVQAYLKGLGLPPDQLAIVSDTVSTRADGSGRRVDLRVIAPSL